jgi:predicted ester cyclase
MTPEEIVKKFVDGFNRHDGSVMALFVKDVAWQDPGGLEAEGGWGRMQSGVLSAYKVFPDILLEVSHMVADSNWASFEGVISGTFRGGKWFVGGRERTLPPTNRREKLSTAWFFKVNSDGLVTYWSFYWDNLQFLAQIGLRPDQIGMAAGP